jgi:8-oxo-dGTP diphosphatase
LNKHLSPLVEVSVAIIHRGDGYVLLASRPSGKGWAGWWEFPGGKIESGENALSALSRELDEELGLHVETAYPWIVREYAYPERRVRLHFFHVRRWTNSPIAKEGQQLSWQNPAQLTVSPLLPANSPVMQALTLPTLYGISNIAELGETKFLNQLERALQKGLRLIQIREKTLCQDQLRRLSSQIISLAHLHGASVLLNSAHDQTQIQGLDGVHLNSHDLMALNQRPDGLVGASCHTNAELDQAIKWNLDFVVVSPVLPTKSHPDQAALGFDLFSKLISDCPIPVYALGGMTHQSLELAWQAGAHGIAMQRAIWEDA